MNTERFEYHTAIVEKIPCNLCGADSFVVLSERLSNGQRVRTCMCKKCGLVYINPRMIRKEYDRYYKVYYHGERLITKGRIAPRYKDPAKQGFENAYRFGRALAFDFCGWIDRGVVLDVGSSYGGLLAGIRDMVEGIRVVGIEPSSADADYANMRGVETHNTLFEDFSGADVDSLSTVFCVQTFNHLLDPRGFLVWSHDHLRKGGHLILAVKNFRQQCRRAGSVSASVQIDHPFMFVPETLQEIVRSVGFEIVYFDVDEHKRSKDLLRQKKRGMSVHHMRLVARKVQEKPLPRYSVGAVSPRFLQIAFWGPYVKLYHFFAYGDLRKRLISGVY